MRPAALCPCHRTFHRAVGFEMRRWVSQTIGQVQHDVRTQGVLDVHRDFRTEEVSAAVEMGLKTNSVVADIAQIGEAEYLISTAVGEDGSIPCHEAMQPTKPSDHIMSGTKVQMVGVA